MVDQSKRGLLGALPFVAAMGAAQARADQKSSANTSPIASPTHLRKVALEEHFMLPEFVDYFAANKQTVTPELYEKALPALGDFGDRRIELMDRNGVDFIVLSLSGPGVQAEPDTATAVRLARLANDALAGQIQRRPKRYGGFAHLPMQDPKVAADELERCLRDFKFQGAMINGQTNGVSWEALSLVATIFGEELDNAAWTKRFRAKRDKIPSMLTAGAYSSTLHYLKAVQAAGTDDAKAVMAKMREMPVNDVMTKNGKLRPDGRLVRDMYLFQVKSPQESTAPDDIYKLVATVPGDKAYRPLNEGKCPFIK